LADAIGSMTGALSGQVPQAIIGAFLVLRVKEPGPTKALKRT
jgi:hypothetical protein